MRKPNRDATAKRTKALAVAAKALEVVASLAPLIDEAAIQLAQELAQEVAPEVAQTVAPEVLDSSPRTYYCIRNQARTGAGNPKTEENRQGCCDSDGGSVSASAGEVIEVKWA
jgi:hypothetical protein